MRELVSLRMLLGFVGRLAGRDHVRISRRQKQNLAVFSSVGFSGLDYCHPLPGVLSDKL